MKNILTVMSLVHFHGSFTSSSSYWGAIERIIYYQDKTGQTHAYDPFRMSTSSLPTPRNDQLTCRENKCFRMASNNAGCCWVHDTEEHHPIPDKHTCDHIDKSGFTEGRYCLTLVSRDGGRCAFHSGFPFLESEHKHDMKVAAMIRFNCPTGVDALANIIAEYVKYLRPFKDGDYCSL